MQHKSVKLIFTSKDTGSAGHIASLATAAPAHGKQSLIVAEGAAHTYLSALDVQHFSADKWLAPSFGEATRTADVAKAISRIMQSGASIVVCGRSAQEDAGIDQTVILAARQLGIPSFVVQDFWGDVWAEDCRPDHYLVIDELAAQVTRERTSASVHVIGSPKHVQYRNIDFRNLRQRGRATIGLAPDVITVGYFGQDLLHLSGYHQVLGDIGDIVGRRDRVALFYKPHPRETKASRLNSMVRLQKSGAHPVLAENLTIETAIASADVVLSCFSTVGLDAAHMMCTPDSPKVSIICADYPEDVSCFWRPVTGLSAFPLVIDGIALPAFDRNTLEAAIQTGLTALERGRQANACRAIFGNPDDPIEKAYKLIDKVLNNDILRVKA